MSSQTTIPFRETKRNLRSRKSLNYAEFNNCNKNLENGENKEKVSRSSRKSKQFRSRLRSPSNEENRTTYNSSESSPTKIQCLDIESLKLSSPTSVTTKSQDTKVNQSNGKSIPTKNVYQKAKEVLNNSVFSTMPCRENEIKKVTDLLQYHLEEKVSGSIYISGPPGTGKTASLLNILKMSSFTKYQQVYINCAFVKSSKSIYAEIADCLKVTADDDENDCLKSIENYLSRTKRMILLILDEIDQLETRKQSILYTIFEWPAVKSNSVVLIGIANALDLTDRVLPRLQANSNLKPILIHFTPYKKQDIIEIITKRLTDANVENVFSPVALQMLASKVAAVSGDLRRALDICRRAIELVEQNHDDRILQPTSAEANVKNCEIKQVGLKEVMSVLNNVFSSSQQLDDKNEALPLQQKIILCTLILMLKKGRTRDILVGKLHETYKKICNKRNISSLDQVEFVGLLGLIETRGILSVSGRKDVKFQKVFLQWDEEEVMSVLKDKLLLSSILEDTVCLGLKK